MISEKLKNIESKIRNSSTMQDDTKQAVLQLLSELGEEMSQVDGQKSQQLDSMGSFAEIGAHEVSRKDGDKGLLDIALSGVRESVKDFEGTHPKLVQVVNAISTQLSNAGL